MHEMSLMADLMNKITAIAATEGASRVTGVKVTLGALSHLSAEHFREHFDHVAPGTVCEGARLDVTVSSDTSDPRAQDIILDSVEVPANNAGRDSLEDSDRG